MLDHSVAENGHVTTDLICFSHLRWDFVFQRPQHLLGRAAQTMRVIFWEEPIYTAEPAPRLSDARRPEGVLVVQPHLPWGIDAAAAIVMQRSLLDDMVRELRDRATRSCGITRRKRWHSPATLPAGRRSTTAWTSCPPLPAPTRRCRSGNAS